MHGLCLKIVGIFLFACSSAACYAEGACPKGQSSVGLCNGSYYGCGNSTTILCNGYMRSCTCTQNR